MIRGPIREREDGMNARPDSFLIVAATLLLVLACDDAPPEPPAAPPAERGVDEQIEITYLANEGFLLASSDHKVLIDGLFREGVEPYPNLSAELRETIETAQPPFDTVDLALATHLHEDHFNALAVCRFLESNQIAEFVSTVQALSQMRSTCSDPAALAGRVRPGLQGDGSAAPFVFEELRAEAVFLHHGAASPIENLGFKIEIGGLTVLHMGDSQANADELASTGLEPGSVDLAFVPFWYLVDRRWTPAIDFLQPAGIVAMHIPKPDAPDLQMFGGYDALVRQIVQSFPQSVVFAEPFETRRF